MKKPHKGEIHSWFIWKSPKSNKYVIFGHPVGHPDFVNSNWIRTSAVVNRIDNVVETENSFYTLVGDEQPLPEILRRRL